MTLHLWQACLSFIFFCVSHFQEYGSLSLNSIQKTSIFSWTLQGTLPALSEVYLWMAVATMCGLNGDSRMRELSALCWTEPATITNAKKRLTTSASTYTIYFENQGFISQQNHESFNMF